MEVGGGLERLEYRSVVGIWRGILATGRSIFCFEIGVGALVNSEGGWKRGGSGEEVWGWWGLVGFDEEGIMDGVG